MNLTSLGLGGYQNFTQRIMTSGKHPESGLKEQVDGVMEPEKKAQHEKDQSSFLNSDPQAIDEVLEGNKVDSSNQHIKEINTEASKKIKATPTRARRKRPSLQPSEEKPTLDGACDSAFRDETQFPRCEFYHRFRDTSLFPNDAARAHTYTRSSYARYAAEQTKDDVKFVPTPLTREVDELKAKDKHALSAHTGGFANPYVLPAYSTKQKESCHGAVPTALTNVALKKELRLARHAGSLYDELLTYKLGLCNHIASQFRGKRSDVDLGANDSKYRVKVFAELTRSNMQNARTNTEIYIVKQDLPKPPKVVPHLYKPHRDRMADKIDLSKYEDLYQKLCKRVKKLNVNSGVVINDGIEKLFKDQQSNLVQENLHPHHFQGVHCTNDYPCVLVRFTPKISDKSVSEATAEKFFETYNHLLMAYFIAIVDFKADAAGINIEMVGRSSFGHNNPSIAVTGKSLRINIGLVPKAYADIVVESLVQLYDLFTQLENAETQEHLEMNQDLWNRLNSKRKGWFSDAELPKTYWQALWAKGSRTKAGHSILYEITRRSSERLELLTNFVLEATKEEPANFFTDVKKAVSPIKRMFDLLEYIPKQNSTKFKINYQHLPELNPSDEAVLADGIYKTTGDKYFQVINERSPKKHPVQLKKASENSSELQNPNNLTTELCESLFDDYTYPRPYKLSMNFHLASEPPFEFTPSHKKVGDDTEFLKIIETLCGGLTINFPADLEIHQLYKFLEAANIEFINEKRIGDLKNESDWGSSSETEEPNLVKDKSIYAKKVIVANGMLAINLSYFAATLAIKERTNAEDFSGEISVSCENTYYETLDCLKAASNVPKISTDKADILIFDLNSFNADFISQVADLPHQLEVAQPRVVILDHTSSTTGKIREAIKTIYRVCPAVYMVLLVNSGLKNEQGGADNNPCGKLTMLSLMDNDKKGSLTDVVYERIKELTRRETGKLDGKALLSKTAHAIRRSYKDRGFTTTTSSILQNEVRMSEEDWERLGLSELLT